MIEVRAGLSPGDVVIVNPPADLQSGAKVLVADEAVSALDVSIQAQILDLLASIQKEMKIAMIFITHDLRVASRICDEILVMNRGEVVECGPPSQIFRSPHHPYTRQLISAIPGKAWVPAA